MVVKKEYNIDWVLPKLRNRRIFWNVASCITLAAVGIFSKIFIKWFNKAKVYNLVSFDKAINRPKHIPLITVSNHDSCFDDPGIWAALGWKNLIMSNKMRWALAANDICFTNPFCAHFFMLGQCVPTIRGAGVYQEAVKFGVELLSKGVLVEIIEKCVEGASVRDVCISGDNLILEETSKVFKKEKEMKKGIAFPVCISANGCICHFSPITSEPDHTIAKDDVLKIDLGVHLDGFISMIAHTIVVGANSENKITDKKANCFLAAHYASQAALRLMRPGNDTYQITDMVMKVCKEFDCKPVEGMLSHQLQQFKLDGPKTIIQNPTESHRKEHEKATIEANEVYALDVLVSTGSGAARETTAKVSVFKKTEEVYPLKLRASRIFYTEVIQKHSIMPFNLRNFEDEKKAKMGVMECVNHKLIEPFQVLFEKTGETVVQYKFTVLVTATGPARITGLPFEEDLYVPNLSIKDPEILSLLKTSVNQRGILQPVKKKKKKTQKNANNAAGENCSMDVDQPSKTGVEKMEVDN